MSIGIIVETYCIYSGVPPFFVSTVKGLSNNLQKR